jgi:hypothetical protein
VLSSPSCVHSGISGGLSGTELSACLLLIGRTIPALNGSAMDVLAGGSELLVDMSWRHHNDLHGIKCIISSPMLHVCKEINWLARGNLNYVIVTWAGAKECSSKHGRQIHNVSTLKQCTIQRNTTEISNTEPVALTCGSQYAHVPTRCCFSL